jgi:hypothetical protein
LRTDPLEVYKENDFCLFFDLQDKSKDHCKNPEAFAKFIGLLDFVRDADTESNASSKFGDDIPDFRYYIISRSILLS